MCLDLAVTGSKDGTVNVHSIKVIISGMEGTLGFLLSYSPQSFVITFFYSLVNNLGTFIEF